MIPDNIITERLILRCMTQDDAYEVWTMWGDHEVGKYLHDPFYESPEVLRSLFHDISNWTDYPFVAISKVTDEIIGTCSIGPEDTPDEWGFGYCVRKEYWGKGYATEMTKALIAFAYDFGICDFTGTCAISNAASGQVMRKCGMHFDHESSFKKCKTDIVYASHIYKMHLD